MKPRWKRKLTQAEYDEIEHVLIQRLKNLFYERCVEHAHHVLEGFGGRNIMLETNSSDEDRIVTMIINMKARDFIEILGGIDRRKKETKPCFRHLVSRRLFNERVTP